MRGVSIALLALLASPAAAHDFWADGEPVPDWVKADCCGKADAHHLQAEHVHVTALGYVIDGYPKPVPFSETSPSQDGEYWAFFAVRSDGSYTQIYCFFAPSESF